MHREAEPAALATDLADAPEAVRLALARALSKDPNARFATCGDFAVALGCQLLSSPAPAPEILLEADVERMTVGRLVRWVSFPWLKNAVHLALTREALWSAYHTEVRRWPLSDVERIEPRSEPVEDREAAEVADAEAVRRLHRDAEASIRVISRLHVIVLVSRRCAALLVGPGRPGHVRRSGRPDPSDPRRDRCADRPWRLALRREPGAAAAPALGPLGGPHRSAGGAGDGGRVSGRFWWPCRALSAPLTASRGSSRWACCSAR